MDIHRMLDKYAVEIGSTEHKIKQLRAEKQGIQEELARAKDVRDSERQAMQAELNALSALSYEIKHLAATISDCQAQNDTLKKDIADEQHARKQLAAEADSAKESFIGACRRLDEEMQALVAAGQTAGAAREADDGADDAGDDAMNTDQGRDQGRAARQQAVAVEDGRAAGALGAGAQSKEGGMVEHGAAEQEGGTVAETSAGAESAGGDPQGAEGQLEQEGGGLGDGGKDVQDEAGACGDEGAVDEEETLVVDPEVAAEGAMLAAVVTLP